jgi:hypothetical protein
MRVNLTDHFAAKIWLPALAGAASLAAFLHDESNSKLRLALAVGWFVIAGAAFWERRRKQKTPRSS